MRTLPLPLLAFSISPLLTSCFTPGETCPVHCWQHDAGWAAVPLDANLGPSAEGFDCNDAATDDLITFADVPALASLAFNGVSCPQTQAAHESIKTMVATIGADSGASQAGSDIQIYQDFVDALTLALRNDCVDRLTAPDIDEDTAGLQTCSYTSAIAVCNAYVLYPNEAALGDLNAGASYEAPVAAPGSTKSISAEATCDFKFDLGQGTGGNDDDDGGATTAGVDDGVDDTAGESTGAPVVDPFGDVSALVWCDQTGFSCVYQDALLHNIGDNFTVFYQEQVALTLLPETDAGYPGARLSGLDPGEAATDLAAAFGLLNGDVIKNVNGFDLIKESDALQAIDAVSNAQSLIMSLERHGNPVQYKIVLRE